jgi:polyisoprenoid-binding protein YceI
MRTSTKIALAAVAILVLAVAAFGGVYLTLFNPQPVARVALPTPAPVASPSTSGSPSSALSTSWKVSTGSFVGYRVREQLAQLPAPSDAVGRTSAVTGTAGVTRNADGSASVTGISVSADLTQLASDSGRRDNFLRNNTLNTSQFPSANFASTAAFTCPATVVAGAAGDTSVKGKFTIHGVTRDVSIPLKIQRSGSGVNIVGSYQFHWGDYGVQQPNVAVASVQSDPTIEISLVLAAAA